MPRSSQLAAKRSQSASPAASSSRRIAGARTKAKPLLRMVAAIEPVVSRISLFLGAGSPVYDAARLRRRASCRSRTAGAHRDAAGLVCLADRNIGLDIFEVRR